MSQTLFAIQTLGFLTGTALFAQLYWLARRALRTAAGKPGRLLIALMGLLWNAGSLAECLARLGGFESGSLPVKLARAAAYTGTAFLATSLLLVPSEQSLPAEQTRRMRWLLRFSYVIGAGLTGGFFFTALAPAYHGSFLTVMKLSAYNLAFHLACIALFLRRATSWTRYRRALLALLGGLAVLLLLLIHFALNESWERALSFIAQQLTIPMALVGLTWIGHFHFADVFVKRSFILLAAVLLAALAQGLAIAPLVRWAEAEAVYPQAAAWLATTLGWLLMLLLFPALQRGVARLADRWLFQRPDYAQLTRQFQQAAERAPDEEQFLALAEQHVTRALQAVETRVLPRAAVPLTDAELEQASLRLPAQHPARALTPTAPAELIVPIREATGVRYLLAVAPERGKYTWLSEENAWLTELAGHLARRLETLRFERERQERHSRETRLQHSLTQAELRALQAQVNPHFLFNTLNTIADLVTTEPQKAEAMTEQLAEVFRYVLARTQRDAIPVSEEFDFLRTYLAIEQARFGARLRVEFTLDPTIATQLIPPLLLQPLVENAVKHGLAPQRAGGTLRIHAWHTGTSLRLEVADDGVGWRENSETAPGGIGLKNVRERLLTRYGDRAQLEIHHDAPGTRIRLTLPLESATAPEEAADETQDADRGRRSGGALAPAQAAGRAS